MAPSAKQSAKAFATADPAVVQGTAELAVPKGPPTVQVFVAPAAGQDAGATAFEPSGSAAATDPG
eukprot:9428263-Lingulodinium_polyedra.AAC.1